MIAIACLLTLSLACLCIAASLARQHAQTPLTPRRR